MEQNNEFEEEPIVTTNATMPLTKDPWWEQIRKHLSHWKAAVVAFITVFGIAWGFLEAASAILKIDIAGPGKFATLCGVAILGAAVVAIVRERATANPGFEDESELVRRIERRKDTHWEIKLSRSLLADRIEPIDTQFDRLRSKTVFLPVHTLELMQYNTWMSSHIKSLMAMIPVMKTLMIERLPASLTVENPSEKAQRIKEVIDLMSDAYQEILNLERKARCIIPPEPLREIYEIQVLWGDVVRDAMKQLFTFFDRMEAADIDGDPVKFEIVFREPDGVDMVCAKLREMSSQPEQWLDSPV